MNDAEAYRTGDFRAQRISNEAQYRALDATLVHSTQWNYTADNSHAHGDLWNEEDLSIFSRDDIGHAPEHYGRLDRGGRGVEGFCRPRGARRGRSPDPPVLRQRHRRPSSSRSSPTPSSAPSPRPRSTCPRLHYPDGVTIEASSGDAVHDELTQRRDVVRTPRSTGPVTLRPHPILIGPGASASGAWG